MTAKAMFGQNNNAPTNANRAHAGSLLLGFPFYLCICSPALKADITNLFIPAAVCTNIISNSRRKSFIILAKVIKMSASVKNVHTVSGHGH